MERGRKIDFMRSEPDFHGDMDIHGMVFDATETETEDAFLALHPAADDRQFDLAAYLDEMPFFSCEELPLRGRILEEEPLLH